MKRKHSRVLSKCPIPPNVGKLIFVAIAFDLVRKRKIKIVNGSSFGSMMIIMVLPLVGSLKGIRSQMNSSQRRRHVGGEIK
jgi:hypothetical protein